MNLIFVATLRSPLRYLLELKEKREGTQFSQQVQFLSSKLTFSPLPFENLVMPIQCAIRHEFGVHFYSFVNVNLSHSLLFAKVVLVARCSWSRIHRTGTREQFCIDSGFLFMYMELSSAHCPLYVLPPASVQYQLILLFH